MTTATEAATPTLAVGSRSCQCPTCGDYFNSVAAFDKHRVGEYETGRRCLSAQEMTDAGMSVNERGFWVTQAFNRDAFAA